MKFRDLDSDADFTGENIVFRDFKRGDYPSVVGYLNSVDWDTEIGNTDPRTALERLYGHINLAVNAFIPVWTVLRSTFPQWFSPRLKSLIREKKRAHKMFKRSCARCSCAHSDYLNFSHLRCPSGIASWSPPIPTFYK